MSCFVIIIVTILSKLPRALAGTGLGFIPYRFRLNVPDRGLRSLTGIGFPISFGARHVQSLTL